MTKKLNKYKQRSDMTTTLRKEFTKIMALFLPGIFLLGFNIGTGSVTSMAVAGADYGMSLLWTIVASCFATFFLITIYGRYTLVTGETALQAFRKHIHPAVGIFFIVALTVGVSGSVMGVMGIVADICFEWSKTMIDGGIAPIYFAAFFIALVYFIFWNGKFVYFFRKEVRPLRTNRFSPRGRQQLPLREYQAAYCQKTRQQRTCRQEMKALPSLLKFYRRIRSLFLKLF